MSKNLNHKDKVNNILTSFGDSVSSSWERFTAFVRGVPKNYIDDESLKKYLYRVQDDNNKEVLDMIGGVSYESCTYAEIAKKLEKITHNNKSWSTRRSDTGKNTFVVHAINNQPIDKIREETAQIKTKQGLVLKYVRGKSKKVNG